jgi:tRNA1(Val) A37 N6-methylase TrmN6
VRKKVNALEQIEHLGGNVHLKISDAHRFGSDAMLLSDFAVTHKNDITCDLGSGCGVIPLLWFREENAPKTAYTVDIQSEAVGLVRESVKLSGLEGKVIPIEADLRELDGKLPLGAFDLVTCNPPYFLPGSGYASQTESDRIARHETMCTLEDVCKAASRLLKYGGRLCLCHVPARLADVITAMRDARIEPKRLRMVQNRANDPPWLILVEGKLGGKPSLRVEAPLVMREGDGPSEELSRIYRLYGKL